MVLGKTVGQIVENAFEMINWNSKKIVLIMTLGFLAIILVFRILLVFSYSPNISVGEDNNIWNIQKMMLGNSLYTDPSLPPFEIFQYTPLS